MKREDMRSILESTIRMKYHDDYGLDREIPAEEIRRIYEKSAEAFYEVVNEELKAVHLKTTGIKDDPKEQKAKECATRWLEKIMGLDDLELSYVVGASLMELAKRGYCQPRHVTAIEKIVGDEFERRGKHE
jgi:hypothetical protein